MFRRDKFGNIFILNVFPNSVKHVNLRPGDKIVKINNSKVRQFITSSNTHTNIKIFVDGIDKYEINYILEINNYMSEVIKLQSSIGTINNK